jgi:hypothetical protein
MPTGPKGQKRPRDPNQLAKLIADIATGQVEDRSAPKPAKPLRRRQPKSSGAAQAGRPGTGPLSAGARVARRRCMISAIPV